LGLFRNGRKENHHAEKNVNHPIKRGEKMTKTGRWILKPKKGSEREFSGTLLKTFNFGKNRLAIFSVPKRFT
jgi:hypothetical protein